MNPRIRLRSTFLLSSFALAAALGYSDPEPPSPQATEVWEPVPPIVSAPAGGVPSDAIVLFDGTNFDAWEFTTPEGNPWIIEDGAMIVPPKKKIGDEKISNGIRTKRGFGSVQLHIEWRTPAEVKGDGQGRGNSGIFFMEKYEVQVLDSYQNSTYVNGQAGAVYKQHPPLVNASRGPGEWQVYDIVFIAPIFDDDGKLIKAGRITAFHNGVLIQHNVLLRGPTDHKMLPKYSKHPAKLPLMFQDHGNPVAFRNIWVRELDLPAPNL